MKKRCDTCKWFGTGCFDKECNYPELESWEPKYPENLDRRCVDCIHDDVCANEEPCKTCSITDGHPSFRQKDYEAIAREEKFQRDINTVRNICYKCKHRDEKYSKAPCSECFEIETHPKFEAIEVEEMKLCCNCKYGTVEFESYPCNECYQYPGLPKWESRTEEIRSCSDCKYTDVFFDDPPCDKCYGFISHPKFERKEEFRTCSLCKYRDLPFDEPPCNDCYGFSNYPKFERRIKVTLDGVEGVTERLKRIIEKDQFLVGIVHPSYMEMHDPKIYYFSSDYCLEEGTEVLVEGDDGTRAWGRVFIPSVPFENEQIEFIRDMGEEIGRVVGIFTPFHKCEE